MAAQDIDMVENRTQAETSVKKTTHRGRYNEPGDAGRDVYDVSKKAREHMREMKTQDENARQK